MCSCKIWLFSSILHFSWTVGIFSLWSHIAVNKLYNYPNFRQEKSGAESVLLNFYSFYNFPRLWEFFKLSTYSYLNLATAKSIFNQEKWPAKCVSISFYFLGNFRFFEGPWEFWKPSSRPCHPFALFFKLSHMPGHAAHGMGPTSRCLHWASPQNWALGSCPRPRATALVDASTLKGNCPCFMYKCSGYWWSISGESRSRSISIEIGMWSDVDLSIGNLLGCRTLLEVLSYSLQTSGK